MYPRRLYPARSSRNRLLAALARMYSRCGDALIGHQPDELRNLDDHRNAVDVRRRNRNAHTATSAGCKDLQAHRCDRCGRTSWNTMLTLTYGTIRIIKEMPKRWLAWCKTAERLHRLRSPRRHMNARDSMRPSGLMFGDMGKIYCFHLPPM